MATKHPQIKDTPGVAEELDADWPSLPVDLALTSLVDLVEIHHTAGPILEVGCGTGRTYEALMRRLVLRPHGYVGLDNTPTMVERAQARYPQADFRSGDLLCIPFAEDAFGSVVCTDVLQHLPELRAPLAEMLRVASDHVFLLLPLARTESPRGGDALAWSDEQLIEACQASGGVVLDFLVVDGTNHDIGLMRVGVTR